MQKIYKKIDDMLTKKMANMTIEDLRGILTPLTTKDKAEKFLDWLKTQEKVTEEQAVDKALEIYHEN